MIRDVETSGIYGGMALNEIAADLAMTDIRYSSGPVSRAFLRESISMNTSTADSGISSLVDGGKVESIKMVDDPRKKYLEEVEEDE